MWSWLTFYWIKVLFSSPNTIDTWETPQGDINKTIEVFYFSLLYISDNYCLKIFHTNQLVSIIFNLMKALLEIHDCHQQRHINIHNNQHHKTTGQVAILFNDSGSFILKLPLSTQCWKMTDHKRRWNLKYIIQLIHKAKVANWVILCLPMNWLS